LLRQILINIEIIAPIFFLVLLGFFLRYIKMINDEFVRTSSKFVFNVSLPALIFLKLSQTDFSVAFDFPLIYFALIITLLEFLFGWLIAGKLTHAPEDKGVFAQGSFRSNFAIVGLAVLKDVLGDAAVSKASIVLAFVMPLYNFLGVISLMLPFKKKLKFNFKKFFLEIILNPLILSVILSLPFSYKVIPLPNVFEKLFYYLGVIALPLALIDIGATVNLESLKNASQSSFAAASLKIFFYPIVFTIVAVLYGFKETNIVVLLILFGCPTAIASFPMSQAMKGNIKLAGNIIVITTLISVLTLSIGLGILKFYGLY
jgi:malonate transporter